ncbi:hypothetical protein [Leptospira sp. GIMC2001]|uniref:hypothetical protein n=1 Tax=Leptospira sp. GIMC2001 TaxID=1513297 RepID=UPI00234B860B|nr:hypothetical protein [Leptospira sp. GIMC2001]WCL48485.1 hypothetical protein O4O04_14395 [Leptospira sp. GIMC2001]
MKNLYSLILIFALFIGCQKPDNGDDNLLLGLFLLSQQSNFEFVFVANDSSVNGRSRNLTVSDQIVNMQGLRKDEYGDGTGDGFQDKFGSASSVSLTIWNIYFWKKDGVKPGEESAANADFTIDWTRQFGANGVEIHDPSSTGIFGGIPALSVSNTNGYIANSIPQSVLNGDYDRVGIELEHVYLTFDRDLIPDPDSLAIITTWLGNYNTDIESHDFQTWNTHVYQACDGSNGYFLQRCTYRTRPDEYPIRLGQFARIKRQTGFFGVGGNEYDLTRRATQPEQLSQLTLGGNGRVNHAVNGTGYFQFTRSYKEISESANGKIRTYIMPIKTNSKNDNFSKLKISVDARNVFHWDSNSPETKFRPHKYPEDIELWPSGSIMLAPSASYPLTCRPNPKGASFSDVCFHDPFHPSIAPDFNSAPWSDNQEAPNPAIGKDMNIYLPAMYAELE